MLASSSVERADAVAAIAWNAALLGAKMVTSERTSTGLIRSVAVRALAREVSPAAVAVAEAFPGTVRTVSIMWTMPPAKGTSCMSVSSEPASLEKEQRTYGLGYGRLLQQARGENDVLACLDYLYALSASHVREACAVENGRYKRRRGRDLRCWERSIQDMVREDRLNGLCIICLERSSGGAL